MRRFIVVVVSVVSLFIAVAFAQTSASLQQARKYFDEHSYQLALEEYQRILAGDPALETKLEATFWRGRSHAALSNWDEARRSFDELTSAGQTDVWAGRAHWWLEPGL